MGQRHGSPSGGRVAGGADQVPHLLGRDDGGQLDPRRTRFEQAVHQTGIVRRDPRHGGESHRVRMMDQPQRVTLRELRVLEVDDGEIETRALDDLDRLEGGELDERADGRPLGQGLPQARAV